MSTPVAGDLEPLVGAHGQQEAQDPGQPGHPAEAEQDPLRVAAALALLVLCHATLACAHRLLLNIFNPSTSFSLDTALGSR